MHKIKWSIIVLVFLSVQTAGLSPQLKLGRNPYQVAKSAVLELESSNQGLLFPRIAVTTLINAVSPAYGIVIFHMPSLKLLLRAGGAWQPLTVSASLNNYWSIA